MTIKLPAVPVSMPSSLFEDLPTDPAERIAALGAIREAFHEAYLAHDQDDNRQRKTSESQWSEP